MFSPPSGRSPGFPGELARIRSGQTRVPEEIHLPVRPGITQAGAGWSVLRQRLLPAGPAGVVRSAGGALPAASPVRPLPAESGGAGHARAEAEQAAGLGGGQGDEVAPGFHEGWRGVCPRRGGKLSVSCSAPRGTRARRSSWTPLSAQAGVSAELRQRRVAVNRLGSRLCQWLAVSVMPRRAGLTSGTANLGFAPAATTRMTNPAASSACRALARPPITTVRPPRPEISDRA
jgi:hypothetical protein